MAKIYGTQINADISTDQILNAPTGQNILLQIAGTTKWSIDNNGNLKASGHLIPNINTSYDIGSTSAGIRNLYLSNSTGSQGIQFINAAGNGTICSLFVNNQDNTIINAGSGSNKNIIFSINGSEKWLIESGNGNLLYNISSGARISSNTSDGSDNMFIAINGGGSSGINRGASVTIGGNESTYPGDLYIEGGSPSNTSYGNIYIITYNTNAKIELRTQNTIRWIINSSGHLIPNSTNEYDIGSSSYRVRTIYAVNALDTSDQRLKTDVVTINSADALNAISALNPIKYKFIPEYDTSNRLRTGFKAQEAIEHVPEAVVAGDADINKTYGNEGFEIWSMQSANIIPYLVAAIKELKARIEVLENK